MNISILVVSSSLITASAMAQTPPVQATAAPVPAAISKTTSQKVVKTVASIVEVTTALTSGISTMEKLVSSFGSLVKTGQATWTPIAARRLLSRLNAVSAKGSQIDVAQLNAINDGLAYIKAWERHSEKADLTSNAAKNDLAESWTAVRRELRTTLNGVNYIAKKLRDEDSAIVLDPVYKDLYGAMADRRRLLRSELFSGPAPTDPAEISALRDLFEKYSTFHSALSITIMHLNAYISALSATKTT